MTGFQLKIRTALALGLPNIARVVWYRLGIALGFNRVQRLLAATPQGPFFRQSTLGAISAPTVSTWQSSGQLFSNWPFIVTESPPEWLANPFTGQRMLGTDREWWQIPDFDPAIGDIKSIWELSRMDWVLALAQQARKSDTAALARLNDWLADWCKGNPPYRGPNWKCGQEASIRVMNLAMAALILGQVREATSGLRDLVRLHLLRIEPTLEYAMAQDNNHGTSEAAALFIGGSWLNALGVAEGERWQRTGRRWLENRAARLISVDGTFSQYSLNYHRVLLDTLCMVEVWRRQLELSPFSARWYERTKAATHWLHQMINPVNGDGPNLGANDGARLLQLTDSAYRDYRPSVQLAMALFAEERAYSSEGTWNHPLKWLGVALPDTVAPQLSSNVADEGGFVTLRRGAAMAMLHYPRFRFRPSQADALHLDLWLTGENLLRDAGSYSYNAEPQWLNYFGGTISHNTVQFDDHDQMPRLSRFLFGDWLKTLSIDPLRDEAQATYFGAAYCDRRQVSHNRRVALGDEELKVVDEVAGFVRKAILRWRLMPGDWQVADQCVTHGRHELKVHANVPLIRCELIEGWESRHYLEKTSVPVLEVEIHQPGTLTTEYRWAL